MVRAGTFDGQTLPEGGSRCSGQERDGGLGYAATLADLADEECSWCPATPRTPAFVRFREDGVMEIQVSGPCLR